MSQMNLSLSLRSRLLMGTAVVDAYAVEGFKPNLVFDFDDEYYRVNNTQTSFSDSITHSASSNATMVDESGLLKWRPHNLLAYSEQFDNAAWLKLYAGSGALPTVTADAAVAPDGNFSADAVTVSRTTTTGLSFIGVRVGEDGSKKSRAFWIKAATPSDVGRTLDTWTFDGAVKNREAVVLSANWQFVQLSDVTLSAGVSRELLSIGFLDNGSLSPDTGSTSFHIWGAHLYRSDLGGMVNNPDRGDSYVPTTSTARYLARRGHHIWNGTSWVNEGLLHESEARTNLLHTTDALVTQSLTVTAVPHTLHFTGTGTVTLLGASTSGPLVGTGTGENNRVSLTFTPTAASLTLTVTGTVTNAQLEVGSTPSSYIPNLAASGSVTRAAETLTIPSAKLPWSSDAVSIQMQGRATGGILVPVRWYLDANNYITQEINTSDFTFEQAASGTVDAVTGGSFTSGVNTSFNIASRHGSTFINGAVDGTALTANTTPTALPDLSATDLNLGFDMMGTIKQLRMWDQDIGDSGIEEASA